ncbi:MAG: fatty acid desaturase [Planctomycetes bacterium]|nr:fatty acid desaturase [Planctomycetota bacterium]
MAQTTLERPPVLTDRAARRTPRLTLMSALFFAMHVSVAAVFLVPFAWKWVLLAVAAYAVRMFAITAGYHRYFSHRTYRLGRISQFILAFVAQSSGQKGVLWWAANHREHHRHSDEEEDHHSPLLDGFWWSHLGWILSDQYDKFDPKVVSDLEKFPELRFIDRHHWICPATLGTGLFLAWGWPGFIWGYLVSTIVLYHCTFTINSLAHLWGTRRFPTQDGSRNNWFLALITFGEGWHNNHHHYQYSCRQGVRWWEYDLTYYVLRLLSFVGIVRDMRPWRPADGE